ncbi:hypothetical protein JCM9140_1691 [Halalkalibacter wakoensis JCM 9140]|uniref:Uncharacterized protein n=1 Tax=Halalkalibacter wakoensis JCM 9140 TaxID=1236970 RepID=W4Q2U2_9BACI|nr:hypothetical protein [Halalkalibacter wakoensis]GAE25684.1 hypothetical protein JCM9140_1691 [Halalkalibacter wakoensis JCM 9140]
MVEENKDQDQAAPLRDQMASFQSSSEKDGPLPPRSRVHRKRSRKKKKTKGFSFPLIKLLLILFLLLIAAAVTSPYWLF